MTKSVLIVKAASTIGVILVLTNLSPAQRQMENPNRGGQSAREEA